MSQDLLPIPEPQWINDDNELRDNCQQWLNQEFLAVDTEFVRTTTFYPLAGLIQIADQTACYLIDPLAISDWQPFAEVLQAKVLKVFHACPEDLEVCRRLTGVMPQQVVDSQTAIALLGHGHSMGFQRAVETFLDIQLDKGETRSNWLQRPLSATQIEYAVADVWFLHHLFPLLAEQLRQKERWSWLVEEGQRVVDQALVAEQNIEAYYRRVKLAWKLRPLEQHVLKKITGWRELLARELNLPRNKVVDDASLWNIARYKSNRRDLLAKSGVKNHIIREHGDSLLDVIDASLNSDQSEWPLPLDKPLSIVATKTMKRLKKVLQQHADNWSVPVELLLNKKALTTIVTKFYQGQDDLTDQLSGWREQLVGPVLQVELAKIKAESNE